MKSLSLFLILATLASCSGGGSGGSSSSAPTGTDLSPLEIEPLEGGVTDFGPMTDENVEVKVIRKVNFDLKNGVRGVLSNLNEFKNHLNVRKIKVTLKNKGLAEAGLKLECFEEETKNMMSASFSGLIAEIEEFRITSPAHVLNPVLNCSLIAGDEKKYVTRVKVLKDFYVSKNQTFAEIGLLPNQKNEIEALVFNEGATLTTNGEKLLIDASIVIADTAKIETFSENEKAPEGQKGKSGGFIKINSEVAVGELEVNMRGQHSGANNTTDTTDYTGLNEVRRLYEAQSNKVCHVGASMQTEVYPQDMSGFNGGDTGQFYLKAKESFLDVDIQSIPGAGGEGGFSRFASKDKVIHVYLTFSEIKRQVRNNGWAYELMDDYHGAQDFVGCALIRRTCGSYVGASEHEQEPNYNARKYHDRCKLPLVTKETLATNFYFTSVNLAIPSGYMTTPTRALSGMVGKGCSERITDNVYECI